MFPVQKPFIFIVGTMIATLTILILIYPVQGLDAAIQGMEIWWEVLFPALFPFFVISEMLLGFGIVHFFGCLLDPMMRPLFRVPGIGGFVMAMGFASGYPVGAKLTSQLWEQRLVDRDEGERLVAFTSTSDPIFLIGAVAVGFFHDVGLAGILAISHYGSGLMVGLIMKYHGSRHSSIPNPHPTTGFSLTRAFMAMHEARVADGRPLGLILQDAITTSLKLVFVIGGLVVFFSVIIELLTWSHIMSLFNLAIYVLLGLLGLPHSLSPAIVNGIFEVTLGAKSAASAGAAIPLIHKVAIAAFVLSWGGLSVHAQIVSLVSHTNMRYLPFVIARLIHGILAAILVYSLWYTPLSSNTTKSVIAVFVPDWGYHVSKTTIFSMYITSAAALFISVLVILFFLYILYRICKAFQHKFM